MRCFMYYYTFVPTTEPTTGLDFGIAYDVMAAVRNLANQGITTLCTIHQPSSTVFNLFDSVILLAGGRMVYNGPVDQVADHFVNSPYKYVLKADLNPAEFVISICGGFTTAANGQVINSEELATHFAATEANTKVSVEVGKVFSGAGDMVKIQTDERIWHTSTWNQIVVLCHRQLVIKGKHPNMIIMGTVR